MSTFCSLLEFTQLLPNYPRNKAFDTDLFCIWMRASYELKIEFRSPRSPKSQIFLPISEEENWLKTERQEPKSPQSAAATKQTYKCWVYLISFVIRKKKSAQITNLIHLLTLATYTLIHQEREIWNKYTKRATSSAGENWCSSTVFRELNCIDSNHLRTKFNLHRFIFFLAILIVTPVRHKS